MFTRSAKLAIAAMAAVLLSIALGPSPARAITHGKPMASGEVCRFFFDRAHLHSGRSGYVHDVETAKAKAVVGWQRFTAWEYGARWANAALARHKRFTCKPDIGYRWNCTFYAQPCKL